MSKNEFDVGCVKLLVDEISENLAALSADGAKYAELRAEVDALKAMLDRPDAQPAMVEGGMKSIHDLVGRAAVELRAAGIRAGIFMSEIGRVLGMD